MTLLVLVLMLMLMLMLMPLLLLLLRPTMVIETTLAVGVRSVRLHCDVRRLERERMKREDEGRQRQSEASIADSMIAAAATTDDG
jgi:hypothetical protein